MKRTLPGAMALMSLCCGLAADELQNGFVSPPPAARPWVYWFPLSGNLTKEGITADLEAMQRVGIGGVLYMETDQGAPKGAADFAGPLWMEMLQHACNEAHRLGLEINMNNDAGWCGSGGPWITPELSMQKVVWSEVVIDTASGPAAANVVLPRPKAERNFYQDIAVLAMPAPAVDARIPNIAGKASFVPNALPALTAGFAEVPAGAAIPRDRVIDLTKQMAPDGKLTWSPPAGKWLVMRFGHTTTGKDNHPAPAPGRGLECDKFSKQAADIHFRNLMGRLIEQNKALTGQGKTLVSTHIDSWEVGSQNWTPLMREEFKQRRGYDLLTFLPVFTGRMIDGAETSERFLWDLRQTVSDLILDNYADEFHKLAKQNGLRLSIEAYGEPADNMAYAGRADEPMGEFWSWARFGDGESCTEMASAAHTYGKQILGAEAFTATDAEKWQGHPGNIKDLGDWAFCEGVNRFVFHRYAAQPWLNKAPGMSMGPWGLHYERTQTWWEQSTAWHLYLARCQQLLQQGRFVADIAYLAPEGAPRRFQPPADAAVAPHVRSGYNFDGCSAEVVLTRMSVKDGRIVLPDGMSYRALVLPEVETMTPALLRKIAQLAKDGAMIVGGAKPPVKSPSLADLGAGDEEVRKTAAGLWTSGAILTGKPVHQLLAERGVPADFSSTPALRHIHRRIGDADVYFVANPQAQTTDAVACFRVTGKQPEIWHPDSGLTESSLSFGEQDGVTRVTLHLEPCGSVFVVFRKASQGIDPVIAIRRDGEKAWTLDGRAPAIKITRATYGVPGDAKRTRDVTAKLQRSVDGGERSVRVASMAAGDDPAFGVVKTLTVEYTADEKTRMATGSDGESVNLANPGTSEPPAEVRSVAGGPAVLSAWHGGKYELQTASGRTHALTVPEVPAPQALNGPWQVRFDPAAGGPGEVTFAKLEDWAQRPEDGIRYYSGTAAYHMKFTLGQQAAGSQSRWLLDLGKVEVMAEVKLNGKNLGILWKPPYRVDVTAALQPGENELEVRAVNLWINRQIGDENLPEDCDRNPNGTLRAWPDWVQQGKQSPTGRFSFSSWKLWKKTDALRPSGLLGPVTVRQVVAVPLP